jgi:hypothetical protein
MTPKSARHADAGSGTPVAVVLVFADPIAASIAFTSNGRERASQRTSYSKKSALPGGGSVSPRTNIQWSNTAANRVTDD